ncbi:MAG: lysophospholipid acyltransferase family protein [bacterium]
MAFNKPFYDFFRMVFTVVFKVLWGFKIYGLENLPEKGGFMLASNHASFLDPPMLGAAIWKRDIKYMARHTLFKSKFGAWFLNSTGSYPIKRGTIDRDAWRNFGELIEKGNAVTFFPEGTRTETGELQEAKPGSGMLIYRTKAMVVPVYMDTFGIWSKGKKLPTPGKRISILFGKPLVFTEDFAKPEGREVYEEITKKVMAAIRELKEELENKKKK